MARAEVIRHDDGTVTSWITLTFNELDPAVTAHMTVTTLAGLIHAACAHSPDGAEVLQSLIETLCDC